MKKIFLIALVSIAFSCKKEGHTDIIIHNMRPKSIVMAHMISIDTIVCHDTILHGISKLNGAREVTIESMSKNIDFLKTYNSEVWEDRLSIEKEYLLFFDKDTYFNYSCDTFKKYKWYQKRELTLDYLNANDWVITYP